MFCNPTFVFKILKTKVGANPLPAGFLNARNHAFVGKLAEAYAAKVKIAHVSALSPALKTAPDLAAFEFGRSCRPYFC